MAQIGLVSCVSLKRVDGAPAADLYISPWFVKAKRYVIRHCQCWYILSAKYGLLRPDEIVEPYELTLNDVSKVERQSWAAAVAKRLTPLLRPDDRIIMLAGTRYREFLIPLITDGCAEIIVPMERLTIGRQLSWLGAQA